MPQIQQPILPVTLVAGDDFSCIQQFYNPDGTTPNFDGSTINAVVTDPDGNELTSVVPQSSGVTGANWTLGKVNVQIPASETSKLGYFLENALLRVEIQIIDGSGKLGHLPSIPLQMQR